MTQKQLQIAFFGFFWILFFQRDVQGQGFGGGPSLALNFAQIDGDNAGGYKKVGLNLGGFVYYSFSERIALQPEILFSQKGAREVGPGISWNVRLNYFDVPVLFRYTTFNKSFGSLILEAGPSFGYLLNAKEVYPMIPLTVTNLYRKYSAEALVGASFRLANGLSLGLRHSISFLSIAPPGPYRFFLRHRYFSILLRFDLKRK